MFHSWGSVGSHELRLENPTAWAERSHFREGSSFKQGQRVRIKLIDRFSNGSSPGHAFAAF